MSWYEPNYTPPTGGTFDPSNYNTGPPNPHHRACDEVDNNLARTDELDISNYIDESWDYPKNQDSNKENRGGDRLQSRVEAHLSNMFPSSAGYFSEHGGYDDGSRFQFFGNEYSTEHASSSMNGVNENEKIHRPVSKVDQFFHPRGVHALGRYENFFSPIVAVGRDDKSRRGHHSAAAKSDRAVDDEPQYHEAHQVNHMSQHQNYQQSQGQLLHSSQQCGSQRETFYGSQRETFDVHLSQNLHQGIQHHHVNQSIKQLSQHSYCHNDTNIHAKQQHRNNNLSQHSRDGSIKITTNPAYTPEEDNSPMPEHSPRNLAKSSFVSVQKSSKSTPAVQSTLTRDKNTGKLGCYADFQATSTDKKMKDKTWDHYNAGGRGVVNARQTVDDSNDKKKKQPSKDATKKKRSSSTKNERQSEVENLLDSMHASSMSKKSKKRQSDGSSDKAGKKSKQKTLGANVTVEQVQAQTTSKKKASKITIQDFAGIEHTPIKNAASSEEGLKQFLGQVGQQKHVTWTMLFLDKYYPPKSKDGSTKRKKKGSVQKSGKFDLPHEHRGYKISTAFLPTSKKYCTEKGE